MHFRFNLLSCIFLFSGFFSASNANVLLQGPREISQEEVAELAKNFAIEFNWHHKYWLGFTCWYEHEQAGLIAKCFGVPVYWCGHRQHTSTQNRDSKRGYYFAQPLKITGERPQYTTVDELARMLQSKTCVFYTGAGISAAKHVATMAQLEESLGMAQGKRAFLRKLWYEPEQITQAFKLFCTAALGAKPTCAHYALAALAREKQSALLTENIDLLQHKTGYAPLSSQSAELNNLTAQDVQAVDVIICIGLSHDDCGFLAYYKRHNPTGLLVALDLKQPHYLSSADFWLQGDIQELVPALTKKI